MKKWVEGLDRLNDRLNKMVKANVEDSMKKACALVEGEAKRNCPVDDGQLRQSITSEVSSDGTQGAVGSNLEYAPYVHQGTGIYAVNGDGRKDRWSYQDENGEWHSTIGQKPNPFLEQALDDSKDDIVTIFRDGMRKR